MKTNVKIKQEESPDNGESKSKAELPNGLTSDSECVKTQRKEVAAICGGQFDPEPLRTFQIKLEEYLDRFCISEIADSELDEVRKLMTDLLENEFQEVPRIKIFLEGAKRSGVLSRLADIMDTIAEDTPVDHRYLNEFAIYHVISKVFFGIAFAEKLRPASAH